MDLTNLVHKRLSEHDGIRATLASYDGEPAIFSTEFPNDQQELWNGKTQYPRISFHFNMLADSDRASSGTMTVSVFTEKNPIESERLEVFVRESLKDVLMKPDGQAPLCVAWRGTDPYMLEGNAILCKEIAFDILEYPQMESTDPDPIMAFNYYIKNLFPDCVVLGVDEVTEFTNPSDAPIFYCRLESLQLDPSGYCQHTVTWFNCSVGIHLLCPDAGLRLKMLAGLNQRLAKDGEIIMLDGSPMTIRTLTVNNRADYLRAGQLSAGAHYGCLNDVLRHPGITDVIIH